jgi:hypothetical protein
MMSRGPHPTDGQRRLIELHFAPPVIGGAVQSGFSVLLPLAALPQ